MTAKNPMTNNASQQDAGKLVEEYLPRIRSFIRNRVPNKDDADDILQDVFYQFVKTIDEAISPIQHISAWLYKVARNTIINKGRKKKEQELPVPRNSEADDDFINNLTDILLNNDETSPTPEMEYLRSLVWTELESALSELPVEQREIFELTELDGIPVKEISTTTGIPVNTLLSRKHYAVLHLRKRMSGLYDEIINS